MTHTRIKFCGFTRVEDVTAAIALNVDYIGLVLRSPRRITLEQANTLRRSVPETIGVVALMMDQPESEIRAVIETIAPDILQFHGREPGHLCASFGLPYWKAIAMGDDPAHGLEQLTHYPSASAFVFDSHAAGEPGGSGQRFDWTNLPRAPGAQRIVLAGGLDAHNVARAIQLAPLWGVDLSSGIESAPGIKSPSKMRAFVEAVRLADAGGSHSRMPTIGYHDPLVFPAGT